MADPATHAAGQTLPGQNLNEKPLLDAPALAAEPSAKTAATNAAALEADVRGELDRVSLALTGRVRQLAERYDTPLRNLINEVDVLSSRVGVHLTRMGAAWT